jgi:hypothetical protein
MAILPQFHTHIPNFCRLPASPCSESVPEPGTPLSRRSFKSVVEGFPRFQFANQYFFSEPSKVLNEGSLGGGLGGMISVGRPNA